MQSSDSEIQHLFKKFSEPDSLICVVSRNMIVPRIPGQKIQTSFVQKRDKIVQTI